MAKKREKKNGNGGIPAVVFMPTHKTRVWFVQATQLKIPRRVQTADGDVDADKGDWIVAYGNGATTVMKPDFFAANFEEVSEPNKQAISNITEKVKEDENDT